VVTKQQHTKERVTDPKKKEKLKRTKTFRSGSFSEHLAIESMGGRHTPIPLQFDAHGLKITYISLRT